MLVGICFRQQINFLARNTLFDLFIFGRLIHYLEAIPIDREGFGLSGIKETLKRLKRGEMVLMFPEGTRTLDGQVRTVQAGLLRAGAARERCPSCRGSRRSVRRVAPLEPLSRV